MNTVTRDEMIEFLKGMDCRKKLLDEEKSRIRGSVETMQEAIYRNNFARHDDGSGVMWTSCIPRFTITGRSDTSTWDGQ